MTLIKSATNQHANRLTTTIETGIAFWIAESTSILTVLHEAVVVIVLIARCAKTDFHTFKIAAQNKVNHAGNRIGAVNRRAAACQHFNTLNHCSRNGIDVRSFGTYAAWRQTTAVDKHESTGGTKTAKIYGCSPGCTVRNICSLTSNNSR